VTHIVAVIAIIAFISPFRAEREGVHELIDPAQFVEIFVNTPLETCEQRDPKGLHKKAKCGELQNFAGPDSPYKPPENPELPPHALINSAAGLADRGIRFMQQCGMLS
jgi:adenylylsulfate kinase-like enzyme